MERPEAGMAGPSTEAEEIIRRLRLIRHPEGGHYRETYRDVRAAGGRGALSLIYYLLRVGERSAWHRIDATEAWHYYAGAPLKLLISADGHDRVAFVLGTNFAAGEEPQAVVPARAWQAAESLGAWTLVGCTVAPAFRFDRFELAGPGRSPGAGP